MKTETTNYITIGALSISMILGLKFKFIATYKSSLWILILSNFSHFNLDHLLENIPIIPILLFYVNYNKTKKYNILYLLPIALVFSTYAIYKTVATQHVQVCGTSGIAFFFITLYVLTDIADRRSRISPVSCLLLTLLVYEFVSSGLTDFDESVANQVHTDSMIGAPIVLATEWMLEEVKEYKHILKTMSDKKNIFPKDSYGVLKVVENFFKKKLGVGYTIFRLFEKYSTSFLLDDSFSYSEIFIDDKPVGLFMETDDSEIIVYYDDPKTVYCNCKKKKDADRLKKIIKRYKYDIQIKNLEFPKGNFKMIHEPSINDSTFMQRIVNYNTLCRDTVHDFITTII